jgi:hypothetical protein
MRVDRFEHQLSPRTELLVAQLEEGQQLGVRQMLDHLRGKNRRQRTLGLRAQIGEPVDMLDGVPLLATALDHGGVGIHSGGGDTCHPQHIEQFATTAADVEHTVVPLEERQVPSKAILDHRLGAAKDIFEARVDAAASVLLTTKAQRLLAVFGGERKARRVGHVGCRVEPLMQDGSGVDRPVKLGGQTLEVLLGALLERDHCALKRAQVILRRRAPLAVTGQIIAERGELRAQRMNLGPHRLQ